MRVKLRLLNRGVEPDRAAILQRGVLRSPQLVGRALVLVRRDRWEPRWRYGDALNVL